jgi:hypothetical protein
MNYQIHGLSIDAEVHGTAEPALVFLHYWGGTSRTGRKITAELEVQFKTVAYDARGWGKSDKTLATNWQACPWQMRIPEMRAWVSNLDHPRMPSDVRPGYERDWRNSGAVNIPILGKYLFGNTSKDRQKEQLMIALIPHIVRKRDITGLDLRGIAARTDQDVKLTYSPRMEESTSTPSAPSPNTGAVTHSSSGGAPGLVFDPVKVSTPVGSQLKLALRAENIADLATVHVKFQWDPMVLRLETISPGPLLTEDGKVVVPNVDIRNDTGDASIDVSRPTGVGKVNGTDLLLQLTFTAIAKGTTMVAVTESPLKTSKQQPIAVQPPSAAITVR